ncbi:putative disease resistance protein At3g14460 [Zingiber officinale]|uniref:Disease resistance protein At3g14460 n=1 Tax=Zingiber officinale TaxID=94328 RepID=A0A8J5I7Z3_ZINOF|nr:putative disease resistance protein At3g14460 [Zingiber officinale]KAG6535270.1 hypothetical protein ZIOFF_000235 [Zingiber officinale]
MHDLIHDLAEWISVEEICRIENNRQTKPPSTTRHLRVEEKLPQEFSGYNKLRTLVLSDSLSDSLFEKLRSIRVLDVSGCGLQELSEHIGKLIHLRYLDISWNSKIKILPDSSCDLYNLQTLKAEGCSELESIPQELGKLVSLRHVDISCNSEIKILPDSLCDLYNLQTLKVKGCSKLESIPQELGKLVNLRQIDADGKFWVMLKDVRRLTNLQELPIFSVQEDDAFKLGQLKDLTQLHGTLRIENLENVDSKEEAQRAELKSKVHLKKLVLEWDYWKLYGEKGTTLGEEVIEGLQPHESLKILKIDGYSGGRSPSWLMLKVLSNLEKLELKNCPGWDDLPFIGQRLHLTKLRMTNMTALKRLSHEFEGKCFPRLEVLELSDFPTLREWSWTEGKDLFPCMRELRVCSCPKLKRLPPFPPSLEMLTIECCPRLILNSKTDDDEEGGRHLPPSLKELKLTDCGEYARLLSDCLNNLTRLEINDCLYMPSISLVQLVELQCLYISDCDELRRMECLGLLKSLKELKIVGCPQLVQLDDELAGSLSSLRKLCVDNTALLKMFPLKNSLPFITELEIKSCSEEVIFEEAILVRSLTAVTSLTLRDCMKLQSLPTELLHGPPLLESLTMQNCPRIKSLPEKGLPPLLQHLDISNCPQIKSLPEKGLPPLLQHLYIYGCPHIQAIPEKLLPMSLSSFNCFDVHPTLKEQSEKFNAYWMG